MAHPHYDNDMDPNPTFVSLLLLCTNFFRNFLVLQKKFHKRWNFSLPKINFINKEEKKSKSKLSLEKNKYLNFSTSYLLTYQTVSDHRNAIEIFSHSGFIYFLILSHSNRGKMGPATRRRLCSLHSRGLCLEQ